MTNKSYIKPETERVMLNTQKAVLITFDPEHSTGEQLGNEGQFEEEEEEYDEFFNEF